MEVLKSMPEKDLLVAVIETLRRNLDIWACMKQLDTIISNLCVIFKHWKSRGTHVRPLVAFILELDDNQRLDPSTRQQIAESAAHYAHVSLMSVISNTVHSGNISLCVRKML